MKINIIEYNAQKLREMAEGPAYPSVELNVAQKTESHLFDVGEEAELVGLVDFPEFNGQKVIVSNVRDDGPHGKAYYIQGEINKFMNWVYEYRLKKV